MNVVAELALVVAVLASAVALAYIMHWWGELHPVTEIVPGPAEAGQHDPSEPDPFAAAVIIGPPAFYDDIGDGEQEDY
jgi:hypothetical protein